MRYGKVGVKVAVEGLVGCGATARGRHLLTCAQPGSVAVGVRVASAALALRALTRRQRSLARSDATVPLPEPSSLLTSSPKEQLSTP